MRSGVLLILCAVLCLAELAAATGPGRALPAALLGQLQASQQLLLTGENAGTEAAIVVVRIDDSARPVYADRINLERVVPPGPFRFTVALGGLVKPNGTPLEVTRIRQVLVFPGSADSGLHIDIPSLAISAMLPAEALGWDLGPSGSALWPGFDRLAPGSPALQGRRLKAIDRGHHQQASEALTGDGIRGIETLSLPLDEGRWYLTLWLRDRGEWEYLPHPLHRLVEANGIRVFEERLSPREWIRQRYLAGADREYQPGDSVWSLFGPRAHDRISFAVDVGARGLRLDFSGHMPEAGYVAAVLAERAPDFTARTRVEAARTSWWRDNWRIEDRPATSRSTRLIGGQAPALVARGTTTTLEYTLTAPPGDIPLEMRVEPPVNAGTELALTLRYGHWRLRRSTLSSTLLRATDRELRAGGQTPPGNALPRTIHLQVSVPADAPAGRYSGTLHIAAGDARWEAPVVIDVPDAALPATGLPIGVYLDSPPQWGWFPETEHLSLRNQACDLGYLASIGITGISPALPTPLDDEHTAAFVAVSRLAADTGFTGPYLAYAPFKRLLASLGTEAAVRRVRATETAIAHAGLPQPAWSVADEPSNPGRSNRLDEIHRYADTYAPRSLLAGQLNTPSDTQYLPYLDIALVNEGFGIDRDHIDAVRSAGTRPWLYNVSNMRAAAGFYLWRSGAEGYLQWHARMPTAAPHDPTDGREDDVQFLYPAADACPQHPDVDRRLFEIVEGINDLRWLRWLEQRATDNDPARRLLHELRDEIPVRWASMAGMDASRLDQWRARITALAP